MTASARVIPPPPPPKVAQSGLRRFRLTLRARLTALYGAMFLLAGMVLLAVTYLVARRSLADRLTVRKVLTSGAPSDTPVPAPEAALAIKGEAIKAVEQARAATLHALVNQLLLALLVVAVVAVALGWLIAGRALEPLQRITATARRVAGSRLHERIALSGPDDELKELADTFDAMLERLDAAFAGQRRFVANASHELRTPLAINRTTLEVAMADPDAPPEVRQLGETLLATNQRSERLIEGLLTLARSENELTDRSPVELADLAGRAVEQTAPEAEQRGVTVRTRLGAATVHGDGVLLERLVLNLVQNGIRHNGPEGWVEVTTTVQAGTALLVVANSGPEVPPDQVNTLFEPFRRLRRERIAGENGVGLGLSIVRSVARAHGGSAWAQARDGGGLVVRVTLPAG